MSEAKSTSQELAIPAIETREMTQGERSGQSVKLTLAGAFLPTTLTEAMALAKLIAKSDMCPKDYHDKPANVLIAMQMGAEVGLSPMAALQNIAVINGRPSLWGDAALGVVQTHPHYESHDEKIEGEGEKMVAICTVKRRGQAPHIVKFSVDDAKKAGLWQKAGPWTTYPKRMLQMRARGFAMRDKFPDALRGLILAEEAIDLPPIDTSDAKKQRDAGTLDMSGGIADLVESSEPNRGHGQEGMTVDKSAAQAEAKPESVMCSDCQKINGHEKSCKYFKKEEQDKRTSKETSTINVMVLTVTKKRRKDDPKKQFLELDCVYQDDSKEKLYIWHESLWDFFKTSAGSSVDVEVAGSFPYRTVEHIKRIGEQVFVNDKPAEQGEMSREPGSDDEEVVEQ